MKTCQNKKICKLCIINHIPRQKCLIFLCFWVDLFDTLEKDGQEIKITTGMKKFHFWVKYAVFIKNENEFLKNSDFLYTYTVPITVTATKLRYDTIPLRYYTIGYVTHSIRYDRIFHRIVSYAIVS